MDLENRIKEFNKLKDDEKVKKILLMLVELKKGSTNFDNAYNFIESNKDSVSIGLIDEIFKTISEAIIYQEYLIKKENDKLKKAIDDKLALNKKEEEKEKEEENLDIDELLDF